MTSSEALLAQTIRRLAPEFPNRSMIKRWSRALACVAVVGVGAVGFSLAQEYVLLGSEARWYRLHLGLWLLAIALVGRLQGAESVALMVGLAVVLALVFPEPGGDQLFHVGELIAAGLIMSSWTTRWRHRRLTHRARFGRSSPRRAADRPARYRSERSLRARLPWLDWRRTAFPARPSYRTE
jgi:hypothetical protein